jgi:hypothetical protein
MWKQQLPMLVDWISIFDDIVELISLDQAFNEDQLMLAATSGSWMEPIMYRLLVMRPLQQGNSRDHVIEEVCRLGTLLFLSPLWRSLGHSPVWTAAISHNLYLILIKDRVEWNELKPLLIWVLYFAAIETDDPVERRHFIFMLAILMSGMQLQEWEAMMQIIKRVLWVEKLYAVSDELIRDEVIHIVNQCPRDTILVDTSLDF